MWERGVVWEDFLVINVARFFFVLYHFFIYGFTLKIRVLLLVTYLRNFEFIFASIQS